jgi:hypothetical protein
MADDIPFPGGPPDPIAFLRRLSSEADGVSEESRVIMAAADRKRRAQDPPARERPAVSSYDAIDVSGRKSF